MTQKGREVFCWQRVSQEEKKSGREKTRQEAKEVVAASIFMGTSNDT